MKVPARSKLLGILLTVVFLALAFYQVDLAELVGELSSVNYLWLFPSALCTLGGYVLRTWRWRVILSGSARAPIRTLFAVLIMGFATNNLLPGRLGEFWRAYLLGRKRNVRKTFALASVFVERVFDGVVLVATLGVVSLLVTLPGWGREIQLFAGGVFVAATVGVALLLVKPSIARVILRLLVRPLPQRMSVWSLEAFEAFLDGLAALRRPSVLLGATGLSLGVWFLEGMSYYLLARGMDLGLPAGSELAAVAFTLVTINLGIMIPSAPGYVGTLEFFGTSALGVFGVGREPALALILVAHAVQYALVTGLGLLFFAREHLSPGSLQVVANESRGVGAERAA